MNISVAEVIKQVSLYGRWNDAENCCKLVYYLADLFDTQQIIYEEDLKKVLKGNGLPTWGTLKELEITDLIED